MMHRYGHENIKRNLLYILNIYVYPYLLISSCMYTTFFKSYPQPTLNFRHCYVTEFCKQKNNMRIENYSLSLLRFFIFFLFLALFMDNFSLYHNASMFILSRSLPQRIPDH